MSRAYLCVSIDTESDKGKGWEGQPATFDGVTDGVVKRLHPLFERFGAKPTYLLAPEVLRDAASVEAFRRLASSSELGARLPGEIARQELTDLTDLFIRAFAHQPQSFRSGGVGIGPESLGILELLGYLVESSVTPHVGSFRGSPTQPYRPDRDDPGRAGSGSILEVPITIRRRLVREPRWLRPTWGTERGLVRVAEDEIAAARRAEPDRPVILNAMFHSVEVVPHTSPLGANEEAARSILDRLRALLSFARRQGFSVVGLGDVPEILSGH